ncbi:unnamed protein product [Rhizoctonia solani]|uniref:Uncharacterized protein n=1 Tax=Rhizoctonia solani TaxID=456999 RepID=A0A8H3CZ31_9AGAM|nr:unnamed protein product [Rhizoctonia solani]
MSAPAEPAEPAPEQSQPKPEAKGSDAPKKAPAPATAAADGTKPKKPRKKGGWSGKKKAAPAQKKDDGESEPEGRAVRRTAGTPSGSEDGSEEAEVKSPKSPKPPTAANSPNSPKSPTAAKSMAADIQAEKAHREVVAARKREQQKVQSSIDVERKKNAQRKMEKLEGREWDARKEDADWNHADKPLRGRGGFEGRGRDNRGSGSGGRGGRGRGRGRGGGPGRQGAPGPERPKPADPNDKAQFPDLPAVAPKE